MSMTLEPNEEALRIEIADHMRQIRDAIANTRLDDNTRTLITEAGQRAHELHILLKERGHEPQHHAYMIKNRGMNSDNPNFYYHFHPIEDLLKFIENPDANNDPEDVTIGGKFIFNVYSNRWGHDDQYFLIRVKDGWKIDFAGIGGFCDKAGRPYLFKNLRQDFINYPENLGGKLEWLWNQAASEGLNHDQVQEALQQLADWVSETEKTTPRAGVLAGS